MTQKLTRTTLRTSRLLDFCSRKELIAQTGHEPGCWPLVILKELVDNALDACEDARVTPQIKIIVDDNGITVSDNGPGIPPDTIEGVLDFSIRVSNREAYVAPDRGAQGNALKTLVAMPFVLGEGEGGLEIATRGELHRITLSVDRIRQEPVIDHQRLPGDPIVKTGTRVSVRWPDLPCSIQQDASEPDSPIESDSPRSILESARERFLQIADDYTWLNPHLQLDIEWFGERKQVKATNKEWNKWVPTNPPCPHWYGDENFERLIAGYIAHDADHGQDRTVREVVAEFRGLTGSAKQKVVLGATGLARTNLSALANGTGMRTDLIEPLLAAMKEPTKPVKPAALGVIGKDHFRKRFEVVGC